MMMWVFIFLAGVIATPLMIELTRKIMNEKARAGAPGEFAKLSKGVVHYQWAGPEDGPVCVCIHGLTTPSFVWGGLTPQLTQMGFRVLTFDHFGRGYSDRPSAPQDTEFFVGVLNELLEDQKVDDNVTLIGYSMGGAIAASFAASQPVGIRQVILLAPAGMAAIRGKLIQFVMHTPVIGTWLMLALYPSILRKGIKSEKNLPTSVPGITKLQEAELNWRGFVPAVLSSLRGTLDTPLHSTHEVLRKERVPVLAIWGKEDAVIPLSSAETLKVWNGDARNEIIDDAGHGLTYTHTDQVAALIDDFTALHR